MAKSSTSSKTSKAPSASLPQSLAAAVLWIAGFGQQHIAERLGCNRATVIRRIEDLRNRGLLRAVLELPRSVTATSILTTAQVDLVATVSKTGQELYAIPNGPHMTERAGVVAALRMLAFLEGFSSVHRDTRCPIGISWGSHIHAMINALYAMIGPGTRDPRQYDRVEAFNVTGDMISSTPNPFHIEYSSSPGTIPLQYPASVLTRAFSDAIGVADPIIFPGPGWIPLFDGTKELDVKGIRARRKQSESVFGQYEGYRSIFLKKDNALSQRANAVVTGIGDADTFSSMLKATGQGSHTCVTNLFAKGGCIGDMSGLALDKSGFLHSADADHFEYSLLGFHRKHFLNIIKNGGTPDNLGVMAICCGRKAQSVAAWKAGVNVLITDWDTSHVIKDLC